MWEADASRPDQSTKPDMSQAGASDVIRNLEPLRVEPNGNGRPVVNGEPQPGLKPQGLSSGPAPASPVAPVAPLQVSVPPNEGNAELIPKDITQSWPPVPTLNGSVPPVHISLFPVGEAIPTQMVPPHRAVHQDLCLQLNSREQIDACQQAVNKCLSWPPAQYTTYLEEVEQWTTKSIKDAGFDSSEADKFSGKRRRMIVSGEDQDYSVANCGSLRERNRQAALAFRKRDVYYVSKLQTTVDALDNKNQILMAAYKQLSTIAHAQNAVWRVGEVALVGVLDKSGALVELIEKRDQFGLFPDYLAPGDQVCSYLKSAKIMFTGRPKTAEEHLLIPPQKFEVSRVSSTNDQTHRCRDTIIPLPPPTYTDDRDTHTRAYLCSIYVSTCNL